MPLLCFSSSPRQKSGNMAPAKCSGSLRFRARHQEAPMDQWFNDFSLLDHMMRRFVRIGTLSIVDAFGRRHVYAATSEPRVTVKLTDARLHRSLLLNPELRAGEAYMDETLVFEEG